MEETNDFLLYAFASCAMVAAVVTLATVYAIIMEW